MNGLVSRWIRTGADVNRYFRYFGEGGFSLRGPDERDFSGCELCKRCCYLTIVANEVVIEVGKAEKLLKIFMLGRCWPLLNWLNLCWVSLHLLPECIRGMKQMFSKIHISQPWHITCFPRDVGGLHECELDAPEGIWRILVCYQDRQKYSENLCEHHSPVPERQQGH